MILQSLLRTYFIDFSLEVFFRKVQNTISGGLRRLEPGALRIGPDDLYLGMRFGKILEDLNEVRVTYYGCKITFVEPETYAFSFTYETAEWVFDYPPSTEHDSYGGYQGSFTNLCEFYR